MRRGIVSRFMTCADGAIKLQVGGGLHTLPGWLNGDLFNGDIYLDARRPLPLPDDSVRLIFAEQFIEHITLGDARKF